MQYSMTLPDILRRLRKQFLAGHYHGDAFTGFHYLFSPSDIFTGFNYSYSLRQKIENPTSQVTLK